MLTLMRKDLGAVAGFGWLILWLVAPSYLVPAIAATRSGGVIFWVNVAFGVAAIVSVCMLDARSGADRFIHSLPVTRANVVLARYGTALVLTAIALAVGAFVGVVYTIASGSSGSAWPRWFAPDVGLAYVLVMAIIISVYLPCYFRWGYGAGTLVTAGLLAVLIIAADVVGGAPDLGVAETPGVAGLPRGLAVRAMVMLTSRWGTAAAALAVAAASAALLAASAALAVRAHRAREF